MKIFPTHLTKQLDALTLEEEGISSIDLMERAATCLTEAISHRWPDKETPFVLFAGPGNNGGDALAVARLLHAAGYTCITVYLFNPKGSLSDDCHTNQERLAKITEVEFHPVSNQFIPPTLTEAHVVIDGLFGSGLHKPLSGGYAGVVRYLNASPATIVSIDIPSGLMGEDNSYNPKAHIVRAHLTLTLGQPKLAFLFAENAPYVGEWECLDIGLSETAIEETPTDWLLQTPEAVADLLKPRSRFAHKGDFGRALLIAGSQGMAGAAILAAKACLRSGVGLLKLHVPFCNNLAIQTAVPEATTELDYHETCFAEATESTPYQAVGIGPGLGQQTETCEAVIEQLTTTHCPMVVDADALNILANRRSYLNRLPKGSVLTPHPGEMDRLAGASTNSYERLMKAIDLARSAQVYLVLKGAYTAIIAPDGRCWFNTTGNCGMATGGSGDVLTGIILSLLAQGYPTEAAARLGVYVHGLAGDMAAKKMGVIGMTAGDIVTWLPKAWQMMEEILRP